MFTPAPDKQTRDKNRYTRSDAGTLSGAFEPTVTGMLIVRYYQNGNFGADSTPSGEGNDCRVY
jgi:hypothetical protein